MVDNDDHMTYVCPLLSVVMHNGSVTKGLATSEACIATSLIATSANVNLQYKQVKSECKTVI